MNIPIYTRSVYGSPKVYPADATQAQSLQALTGCKTLDARHITALQDLGIVFQVVPDPKAQGLAQRNNLQG
jgi:hypothetical protein